MKFKTTLKVISAIIIFITSFMPKADATIFSVTVANLAFSPNNIPNVVVGDTIRWTWVSGFHTTTSTSVPGGAVTWDAPMNSTAGNQSFDYKVTSTGVYSYNCSIHPTAMIASFTVSNALPVRLSEFKISNDNNNAILNWTTQSEENIDYFSIQKSKTGADFYEVGRVPAAGNSSQIKLYSYTDPNASSSDKFYYYTLAIVDKEGKKEFSPVQLFKNKIAAPKLIISLSPNPVSLSGHLMLKFNADKVSKMNVKVSNMEGKMVFKTTMQASEGVNFGHLMLDDISAGSYSIMFELNGLKETYKLIVR